MLKFLWHTLTSMCIEVTLVGLKDLTEDRTHNMGSVDVVITLACLPIYIELEILHLWRSNLLFVIVDDILQMISLTRVTVLCSSC